MRIGRKENAGMSLGRKIETIFLGGIITASFAIAVLGADVMIEKPHSDAATIHMMTEADMARSHTSAKVAYENALKKDAEHSEGQGLIGVVGGLATAGLSAFGLYMVKKFELD